MNLRRVRIKEPEVEAKRLRAGKPSFPKELLEKVKAIVEGVREGGDEALLDFVERFDGSRVERLRVEEERIRKAYDEVPGAYVEAISEMKSRLEVAERPCSKGFG